MADWQLHFDKIIRSIVDDEGAEISQPIEDSTEIWIKGTWVCEEYDEADHADTAFWVMTGDKQWYQDLSYGMIVEYAWSTIDYLQGPNSLIDSTHRYETGLPLPFVMHIFSDETNGVFEVTWGGGSKETIVSGNVNNGNAFNRFRAYAYSAKGYLSNVTVANYPLYLDNQSQNVDLYVDTLRNVSAWRYENYGTADLLSTSGTTVTNLTKNQAVYQTAFYQPNRAKCFDIPATSEIWIKCDINVVSNVSSSRIRIYNDPDQTIFNGWSTHSNGITSNYLYWINGTSYDGGYRFSRNDEGAGKIPFLLHMKSGVTDGFLEFYFYSKSNKTYKSFTGNVNNGNDFDNVYIQMDGSNIYVSDLIISNVAVDINEHTKYPLAFRVDLLRNVVETFAQQFYVDTLRNVVRSTLMYPYLKTWLDFNYSPTADAVSSNAWETYGNPTVSAKNAVRGNALQLDGEQCIYLEPFELGGQDFCIEGTFYAETPKSNGISIVFEIMDEIRESALRLYVSTPTDGAILTLVTHKGGSASYRYFADSETAVHKIIHFKISYQHDTGLISPYFNDTLITTTDYNQGVDYRFPKMSECCLAIGASVDITTFGFSGAVSDFRIYDGVSEPPGPSVFTAFDTYRNIIRSNAFDCDTYRDVTKTVAQNLDTVRTLAHTLILSPVYNFGDLPDTSDDRRAGLQSFEIQIGEQQLTDSANFVTVNPVDILEQVKGQYLDYKFNMRVEKIVQRGILRTCNCCSDIDELLFKQLDYVIPEEKRWTEYAQRHLIIVDQPQEPDIEIRRYALASEHINAIANAIGKTPVLQFADFISNVDIKSGGTTYNNLIKAIFGWSARVPQMMINCYLRDDKLYVVQRGYESNIVDLTNYQSEVVSVSKDIARTYWGSQLWSKTEVTKRFTGYVYDFITKALPTEKVDDNGKKTTYQPSSSGKVLVTRTEETVNGQTIVKTFDYDSDDFLIQSTEQGDAYKIETTYTYEDLGNKRKVLQREETVTMEKNSNDVWEVTDRRTTTHNYLHEGGGQVYVSSAGFTDFDVDHTGNVVGNGSGDDRISPYQIHVFQNGEEKILESIIRTPTYDAKDHRTIYGVTLFDSSFPVHGDDKLIEITDAIKWLNRKTQEVINLNVYDFPHVIDFNDKIVFGGNTYFLRSNSALKNDDIVNKQSISAVRWY